MTFYTFVYFAGANRDLSKTKYCTILPYGDAYRVECDIKGQFYFEVFGSLSKAEDRKAAIDYILKRRDEDERQTRK